MWFHNIFSFPLVEFESCSEKFCVQELQKTIEQHTIHFGHPQIHLGTQISESIWRLGSGNSFTVDISEWLHLSNAQKAYSFSNKVDYIRHKCKHNNWCIGLQYVAKIHLVLALLGWSYIDCAKIFNLLSCTNTWRNTTRAHLLHHLYCQEELFFHPVSQHVHHLSKMHVHGVCRSIELTSLRDASVDFGIPPFG